MYHNRASRGRAEGGIRGRRGHLRAYTRQSCYLTGINCGPSCFAIWHKIRSENAAGVSAHLLENFRERGPPDELLMDNSTTYRLKQVAELRKEWNVHRQYRAAYRPSVN